MKIKYTEKEIIDIFKEQHRLCSPLDFMADPSVDITPEMTIQEWRYANDLLEWSKLSRFLNKEFRINVSKEEWRNVLEPDEQRQLKGVCQLISKYAEKDSHEPIILFGQPCLKASVFLTMKKNLKAKGVDVSNLRPSSNLGAYIDKYFSPVLEEITLTGTKPIEEIIARRKKKGFWHAINIWGSDRHEIITGDVKTFRDLIERIIEEKNKN